MGRTDRGDRALTDWLLTQPAWRRVRHNRVFGERIALAHGRRADDAAALDAEPGSPMIRTPRFIGRVRPRRRSRAMANGSSEYHSFEAIVTVEATGYFTG